MKAANIVTKMIAYLEVMLNRNLDIFYLSIQKYLYDNLTDDIMIDHIRDKIHLLDFEKCQKLVEINPDYNKKRDDCLNDMFLSFALVRVAIFSWFKKFFILNYKLSHLT